MRPVRTPNVGPQWGPFHIQKLPARSRQRPEAIAEVLLLFDLDDLFAPIGTAIHADTMRSFRRTTPLTRGQVRRFDLPLAAALAASSLRNPYFWYSPHSKSLLINRRSRHAPCSWSRSGAPDRAGRLPRSSLNLVPAPGIIEARTQGVKVSIPYPPAAHPIPRSRTGRQWTREWEFLPDPCAGPPQLESRSRSP